MTTTHGRCFRLHFIALTAAQSSKLDCVQANRWHFRWRPHTLNGLTTESFGFWAVTMPALLKLATARTAPYRFCLRGGQQPCSISEKGLWRAKRPSASLTEYVRSGLDRTRQPTRPLRVGFCKASRSVCASGGKPCATDCVAPGFLSKVSPNYLFKIFRHKDQSGQPPTGKAQEEGCTPARPTPILARLCQPWTSGDSLCQRMIRSTSWSAPGYVLFAAVAE